MKDCHVTSSIFINELQYFSCVDVSPYGVLPHYIVVFNGVSSCNMSLICNITQWIDRYLKDLLRVKKNPWSNYKYGLKVLQTLDREVWNSSIEHSINPSIARSRACRNLDWGRSLFKIHAHSTCQKCYDLHGNTQK